MIIGTIALLTLLFGGGVELFFINNFDKGVKEYVIEKDRQKEILADLKTSKKLISNFNKEREKQYKLFKKLNVSHETTKENLVDFFNDLHKERLTHQEKVIDKRISVIKKIKADEWDSIMVFSKISLDKQIEKEQKKLEKNEAKGKEIKVFEKTRKAIINNVSELGKQQVLITGLNNMINTFEELSDEAERNYVNENDILIRKDATKDELEQLAGEMNDLRRLIFDQLIEFHFLVKENTNISEWDKIMKAFTKEFSITAH